jgi:cytosine/adenosine deaminase-related metal-dependent hydrolase
MMWRRRVVSLVNGRVHTEQGEARSIRFASTILGIDQSPRRGDVVVDLDGAVVLPGLVNAHDHLELNHYGRLKFRDRYANVSHWIDDMRPRLQRDPQIVAGRSHSLSDRLFVGILKNLLAGVTTVAHHNPFYRELGRALPIRVLRRYGWAHSFYLQHAPAGARGEAGGDVASRHRSTPAAVPFFVHVAEGIDADAAGELQRLESLGCLRPNLVLIHGLAMTPADWRRARERGAGLVWCPGSNHFLFDRTARVREFLDQAAEQSPARIGLGTDSRLSGRSDLLDEARAAAELGDVSPGEILRMVTAGGGDLLRQRAGRTEVGAPADLMVMPPAQGDLARALLALRRRDVRLVVVGGQPKVGHRSLETVFAARRVATSGLVVDDARLVADSAIVTRVAACAIREPGVAAA